LLCPRPSAFWFLYRVPTNNPETRREDRTKPRMQTEAVRLDVFEYQIAEKAIMKFLRETARLPRNAGRY